MHFGRVPSISGLDLHIPPDSLRTEKFLALARPKTDTEIYIGCPIWSSRHWVGNLYPKGTPTSGFLKAYATQFRTVEVNSTFYHLLGRDRIAQWKRETPQGFRFCPKVFRGITESLAAREMPELVLNYCESIRAFEGALGLTFAQFPETFGPNQVKLLERFLNAWPTDIPLAVELRHPDWFFDNALVDSTVNLLYRHKVATVITDTPGRRDVLHLSLTQPKVLIRFQGNEGEGDQERLMEWGERLRKWSRHSLEEIYFFTHQPDDVNIPETAFLARETIEGTPVPRPQPELPKQIELL